MIVDCTTGETMCHQPIRLIGGSCILHTKLKEMSTTVGTNWIHDNYFVFLNESYIVLLFNQF